MALDDQAAAWMPPTTTTPLIVDVIDGKPVPTRALNAATANFNADVVLVEEVDTDG